MKALTGNFRLATTISLAALLTGCAMPQQGGKQILSTNNIYPAVGPYSQMVEHSGTIYLSGVLPLNCLLYTSPSPRDRQKSRMPSSA